jgi:D-alanyl-D-alanine dipeptidase
VTVEPGAERTTVAGGELEQSSGGWRCVPISECGESLQQLIPAGRLFVQPIYRRLGYASALDRIYLRTGVIERLAHAARALPEGFALLIWDGWRPVNLQADLYHDYRARIARESQLQGRALDELVERFVSVPSSDPASPSPHVTGGAVDLTLADSRGQPASMGGEFDELTERSRADYYDAASTPEAGVNRRHRRLLLRTMRDAGFTDFPSEWWHFDYGNQFWGYRSGRTAIYGKAAPPSGSH